MRLVQRVVPGEDHPPDCRVADSLDVCLRSLRQGFGKFRERQSVMGCPQFQLQEGAHLAGRWQPERNYVVETPPHRLVKELRVIACRNQETLASEIFEKL